MRLADLDEALAAHGLIARGGFVFGDGEEAPPGSSGGSARSVILVGHGGGTIWPHFSLWLAAQPEPRDNPLDTWSKIVLDGVAATFGARAVYPSDKPWLPFQRWAMRAEGLRPSPLGILMHPEFGLWHAYRGALLFEVEIPIQAPADPIHLCDACDGKPCVNSCPAGAVGQGGLDVSRCHGFLTVPEGEGCRDNGCAARAACPFDAHRYGAGQVRFHMAAHLRGIAQR